MSSKQKQYDSKSSHHTQHIAREFVNSLRGGENIFLFGELGSGKTTFVQGLAQALGITEPIQSPTFLLMRGYTITKNKEKFLSNQLLHVDLYRLENPEEIISLGLQEAFSDLASIVIVEWAERIPELPIGGWEIHFKHEKEQSRKITFIERI